MNYVLDACALIAFLNEERGKGFEAVDTLIERAEMRFDLLYMHAVNLVEVYYNFIRDDGVETADEIMRAVMNLPITVIETIKSDMRREAARFKGTYRPLSFADAFLCATAKSIGAVIVTKDSEIRKPEQAGEVSVLWINR